jgi:hypothetical protein
MSKPKIAQKVLGDGAELYEFLLKVVRGEVCDRKWVKERYQEVEVDVPVGVKVRSDVAKWLIEQLHGRAGTTLAVTTDASPGLVQLGQLPTGLLEQLSGLSGPVERKTLQENFADVQTLPDDSES